MQCWILGSIAHSFLSSEWSVHLLSSALTHLFSPLPSPFSWGHRRVTLVYLHIPSLCFVESATVCQSLKLKGNLRTLCTLSLSLFQSAHYMFTLFLSFIHSFIFFSFALTWKNKIIKDSCKTKKEIFTAQGHYKGSVC